MVSKHNDDKQMVWESTADGSFTVAEDPRGNTLGRGTEITLFLKEEANDMAGEGTLRNLVKKYSEFVTFPIHLRTTTYDSVEVVDEEATAAAAAEAEKKKAEAGDDEDVVVADEEAPKPKMKTETKKTLGWEVVNNQKAIWQRKNKDISDAEYKSFFKAISKDVTDPLTWIHFTAEGEVEFRSILYIPTTAPGDLYGEAALLNPRPACRAVHAARFYSCRQLLQQELLSPPLRPQGSH